MTNFHKKSSGWLILLLVAGSMCFLPRGEVYFGPWYWTFVLLAGLIAHRITATYGLVLGLNFLFWVTSPMFLGHVTPFAGKQHVAILSMQAVTKDSIIFALLFSFVALLFKSNVAKFRQAFCFLWLVEAVSLLLPRSFLGLDGFLGNTTIGCCFLVLSACMMPKQLCIYTKKIPVKFIVLTLTTLLVPFFSSATAFAALVPMWVGSYWLELSGRARMIFAAPPLLCLSLIQLVKSNVFMGRDRYELWSLAIEDFWQGANHWIGYGHGTYKYLGPQIQLTQNYFGPFGKEFYLWLHNDWIQLFFEGGIVGISLAVLLYIDLLIIFYKRNLSCYFAGTLVFGSIMASQYPLELPVFALFGIFLIIKAYSTAPPRHRITGYMREGGTF